jgi:hypothetical protein
LIEPLGHKAKEKNQKFYEERAKIVNLFDMEFAKKFCLEVAIDWKSLVRFNSRK